MCSRGVRNENNNACLDLTADAQYDDALRRRPTAGQSRDTP
ncbi:hypothetical protein ACFWPV_01180 [Streptomyces uncialis]